LLLYIVNLVSIFFDSQIYFILRFKKELRRATNASKIIINKKEAKDNAKEAKEIEVETKRTKASTKASARANAKATTTTTTITINRKQLSKLRKQFVYTHLSLVLEIASILSSYLLLFNNSRECASNTLYSQKLIKLLN